MFLMLRVLHGTLPTSATLGCPAYPSRLVSVFCIPPSYNITIDGAGNLPGPGAVSLAGEMQLLP
jgi:hypothetical protein